jgi:hypothetical protein
LDVQPQRWLHFVVTVVKELASLQCQSASRPFENCAAAAAAAAAAAVAPAVVADVAVAPAAVAAVAVAAAALAAAAAEKAPLEHQGCTGRFFATTH